jgi:hypothetical protein
MSFGLLSLFNLPKDTKTDASLKCVVTYGKSSGVKSVNLTFPF